MAPTPIAVTGMSCRLSGGANDPEKLWSMLTEGRDSWSDTPPERYNWESFHHPDSDMQASSNQRGGHYIDQDIAAFDAKFFAINDLEAHSMDPAQRLLLELSYEALENAGYPLESVYGSRTGVYIAHFGDDYARILSRDPLNTPKYFLTGCGQAILANRISHTFNLQGPSLVVDTACSGGMVALHQACLALRSGEIDLALVGAANLLVDPDLLVPMSLLHFLNSDGRSYAFDSRGSGYGRGEGIGVLILKRVDDAKKAGDPIRAAILNTGIGQDGKTAGITLPSEAAQKKLIDFVYQTAELDPRDTAFVEAHGTGTLVGDIAEMGAISHVFGSDSDRQSALQVGSIKVNIGHTEAFSGLAGVIKAVLAVEKGLLPPTPGIQNFKPNLLPHGTNIQIPQTLEPWQRGMKRRAGVNSFGYGGTNVHCVLEAISSATAANSLVPHAEQDVYTSQDKGYNDLTPDFDNSSIQGTSGRSFINGISVCEMTNSHVRNGSTITNGQPAPADNDLQTSEKKLQNQAQLQSFNGYAKTNGAMHENISIEVKSIHDDINNSNRSMDEKALRQTVGCSAISWNPQKHFLLPVTAKSKASLARVLENTMSWINAEPVTNDRLRDLAYTLAKHRSIMSWRRAIVLDSGSQDLKNVVESDNKTVTSATRANQLVFIFTGQGAQGFAMGRELIGVSKSFTLSLQKSAAILQDEGALWNLVEELCQEKQCSRVDDSELGQPISTAIQIALVELFAELGVRPDIVLGHSSGEIAAAYAAGLLSQAAALRISYCRGLSTARARRMTRKKGAMLAVNMGEQEAVECLALIRSGKAVVACVNSPKSVTLSGDEAAIDQLSTILQERSIFARRLKVDTAYHSHYMDMVADLYLEAVQDIQDISAESSSSTARFFSSVTGKEESHRLDPTYWVRNLVSQVRFKDALEQVCQTLRQDISGPTAAPHTVFLEIGPHHALAGPVRDTVTHCRLQPEQFSCVPSLMRAKNAELSILQCIGRLFEKGHNIDIWKSNNLANLHNGATVVTNLAPYPWDHSLTYWSESRLSMEHRFRRYPNHDLLGLRVAGTSPQDPVWRHIISTEALPWTQEHIIDGHALFPASAFLAMAMEAKKQISVERAITSAILTYRMKDVSINAPVPIPESPRTIELQITLKPAKRAGKKVPAAWEDFTVSSVTVDGKWQHHCSGSIMVELASGGDSLQLLQNKEKEHIAAFEAQRLRRVQCLDATHLPSDQLYEDLRAIGNDYGSHFATIRRYDFSGLDAVGSLIISDVASSMPGACLQPHTIHPTTLDTLLHTCLPLFARQLKVGSAVSVGIDELSISAHGLSIPGTELQFATKLSPLGPSSAKADVSAFQISEDGQPDLLVKLTGGELRGISNGSIETAEKDQKVAFEMEWDVDLDACSPHSFRFHESTANPPVSNYRRLNQATSLYIRSCLTTLTEDLVTAQHKHFFAWIQRYSASDESLSLLQGLSDPECTKVLQSISDTGIEGEAVIKVGQNLAPVLMGKIDPLTLATGDDFLFRGYADEGSIRCYEHMIEFVKRVTFKQSDIRILEVGAGTGGATLPLLEAITKEWYGRIGCYDFTDVSTAFFERARLRFQDFASFMQYKVFDLSRHPEGQGFQAGSYDLVIASNSIHVTSSTDDALGFARSLLRPGGRLLLVETTKIVPFANMIMGPLPGWFVGVEDGRIDAPLLSKEQWHEKLTHNGFSGIDHCADDFHGPSQRVSFMATKAVNAQQQDEPATLAQKIRIVLSADIMPKHTEFVNEILHAVERKAWLASTTRLSIDLPSGDDEIYVVVDDIGHTILNHSTVDDFGGLMKLLASATAKVLWINAAHECTHRAKGDYGVTLGLCRSARAENSNLRLVTLDMADGITNQCPELPSLVTELIHKAFIDPQENQLIEPEYRFSNGNLLIPRLKPCPYVNTKINQVWNTAGPRLERFHQDSRPLKLYVQSPGLLDSMIFTDDELAKLPLAAHEVEIQVEACSINFKDVMVALGQVKQSVPMVGEAAGVVTRIGSDFQDMYEIGDRVMFTAADRPYASRARTHGYGTYPLPDSLSFAEGASIPVVFIAAHLGLVESAKLRKDQSVLIHSAAGGVGQAALQVAQSIGAKIFVTVGSMMKKDFIMNTYGIPEDRILSSRDGSFKQGILRMTHGEGVDVVLNSLSGDLLQDSLDIVARFGSFVEIGKFDIYARNSITLEPFDKAINFFSIDMTALRSFRPRVAFDIMSKVMPMFDSGTYRSVQPITIMPLSKIQEAFQQLQQGKHIGKIVFEINEETTVLVQPRIDAPICLPDSGTYLIAGGLGGLGLEIGRFIARRGAKHIALVGRSTPSEETKIALAGDSRLFGSRFYIIQCDISSPHCKTILQDYLKDLPPVEGIFQSAMLLQGHVLEQMSLDNFRVPLSPKVDGTRNLSDAFSGPHLKFFIMFSSVASVFGNRGGSNYAASNAFLDAVAAENQSSTTRYTAINLGPIGDAGVLTRESNVEARIATEGFEKWGLRELFAIVDPLLDPTTRDRFPHQIVTGFTKDGLSKAGQSWILGNPLLRHVFHSTTSASSIGETSKENLISARSIKEMIANAITPESCQKIIIEPLAKKVSAYVAMEVEQIESVSIADLGLDSLIVVELKNWIARIFQATLQTSELSNAPSLRALASIVCGKSTLVKDRFQKATTAEKGQIDVASDETELQEYPATKDTQVALPRMPMPDQHSMFKYCLSAAQAISSGSEHKEFTSRVREFERGFGKELHKRLVERVKDLGLRNWYSEVFTRVFYGTRRASLVNNATFFGSQYVKSNTYSPAEVAAAFAVAAFDLKQKLECGQVKPAIIADQETYQGSYEYLFNAHREPRLGEDFVQKHKGNDYIIVFRRGHAFKIVLQEGVKKQDFQSLRAIFEDILSLSLGEELEVGILTADGRDEWAEYRQELISVTPSNKAYVDTIEAAAFLICFDEAMPKDANQRAQQFLFGERGLNRWYDKSLQFVVCSDGTSASLFEHTKLDGLAMTPVREHILPAVRKTLSTPPPRHPLVSSQPSSLHSTFSPLPVSLTPHLNSRISYLRSWLSSFSQNFTFSSFALPDLNITFWRSHKISPKHGLQLTIQLASYRFFGHTPAQAAETVSIAHFDRGRVMLGQTVWPEVVRFCEEMSVVSSDSNTRDGSTDLPPPLSQEDRFPEHRQGAVAVKRQLFHEAASSLARSQHTASRGGNWHGYMELLRLLAMEEREHEHDPLPEIFEDPVMRRMFDIRLITDCFENDVEECGLVSGGYDVWLHFEGGYERTLFTICGRGKYKAADFRAEVERAAGDVKALLEGTD